jgi:multidrug efflux system membrane fusion protein
MRSQLFPLAFAAATSAAGFGCNAAHASPPAAVESAVPVTLAPVVRAEIARPIRAAGVVRAETEVDLGFETAGVVAAVLVEQGAVVKRGQPLARLDGAIAHASVAQAVAAREKALRDRTRAERLEGSGALPANARQDADTAAALAEASYAAATRAERQTVLLAPADGRIDRRNVEPGQVVGAGVPVFHFAAAGAGAIVRVALADRDVQRVALGGDASITLDISPDSPLPATISKVAAAATPGVGTFEVELRPRRWPSAPRDGLTAKVTLAHVERPAAIVPTSALVDGDGERAAVFVVDAGRARRLAVRVAFIDGERAALRDPLPSIDAVVDRGAGLLAEGRPLRVVAAEERAEASARP